jgi:hypothetical protein
MLFIDLTLIFTTFQFCVLQECSLFHTSRFSSSPYFNAMKIIISVVILIILNITIDKNETFLCVTSCSSFSLI